MSLRNIMDNKDLVITAVDGMHLTFDYIRPFVNSLKSTGYKGAMAIVAYNINKDFRIKLAEAGFTVYWHRLDYDGNCVYKPYSNDRNVVVDRFHSYSQFLKRASPKRRFVIAVDAADVIFQKNPSDHLSLYYNISNNPKILTSLEDYTYVEEPWSYRNMSQTFDFVLNGLLHKKIACAGTITAEFNLFIELCDAIYHLCVPYASHTPGGGGPDQSAYNVLINQPAFSKNTIMETNYSNWSLQAGTCKQALLAGAGDIGLAYRQGAIDQTKACEPIFKDGLLYNPSGELYHIVHQYNRVPEWKEIIEKKYNAI